MLEKQIPNFPGYWITSNGEVFSLHQDCTGHCTGWLKLKEKYPKNGLNYLQIGLCKNKKCYYRSVHRLVLETFVGPCPDDMEACHNNGDKQDNRLSNLRWDTHSSNIIDAIRVGTHRSTKQRGEENPATKLKERDVRWMRFMYSNQLSNQHELADWFDIAQTTVSQIVNNKTWKHI